MNIDKEREAFCEAYPAAKAMGFDGEKFTPVNDNALHSSICDSVNHLWSTWQARAAYQRQSGVALDNVDEAASILRNMIDSIGTHGNYSNESTLLFLNQALSCLDEFARLNGAGSHE